MKCFNVVLKVLDATYDEIPGSESERDAEIKSALKAMSERYSELLKAGGPDFADPVARFAYVYCYVPAHAHWVYELIEGSTDARAIFEEDRVRMTCLGGGPGSDLVGALKYITETKKTKALFCEIVDGCLQWKSTWSDLAYTLDLQCALHTDYVIHDVADLATWEAPNNFKKADLFTLNFFASEITHLGGDSSRYLSFALSQAKPGAILIMNDNNDKRFYGWVEEVAASQEFKVLRAGEGERKIYDTGERMSELGRYADKFGRYSKLTGQLAWRVFRKG